MNKKENRNQIAEQVSKLLDTRDKRAMFLQCYFREHVMRIDLEGSNLEVAHRIVKHFDNANMLGSFTACFNETFENKIEILIQTDI